MKKPSIITNFFGSREEEEYYTEPDYDLGVETPEEELIMADEAPQSRAAVNNAKNNVLSMNGAQRKAPAKIALYEPRTYADAQAIATQILQGEAVIVNFGSIDDKNQLRVLDYIAGATFAVNGLVERVGDEIFLATPNNFEISGAISQNVNQQFN